MLGRWYLMEVTVLWGVGCMYRGSRQKANSSQNKYMRIEKVEGVVSLHLRLGWRVLGFCFERFIFDFWKNMDATHSSWIWFRIGVIST